MRKVLSSLIFMISFFTFISNSEASCTYKRISDLKKIASNVNITYTYTIVDNKASFDIRFANLTNDIYLYDSFNNKKYNVEGEVILKNYIDGVKYRFFINSNDKDCKDEQLVTRYVTLPKYNIYYGDPICNGIEDYTLCQKWGSFNINNYDALYLSGGEPKYLMDSINNANLYNEIKEFIDKGGIIIGQSAGAMIFSKNYYDTTTGNLLIMNNGYDYSDKMIVPHYNNLPDELKKQIKEDVFKINDNDRLIKL